MSSIPAPQSVVPVAAPNLPTYHTYISQESDDPDWDTFVSQTAGNHYAQTSMWEQLNSVRGRQTIRCVVLLGGRIVAGAQISLRTLPLVGALGYVARGPIVSEPSEAVLEMLRKALHQAARAASVRYLIVQPPREQEALIAALHAWGFRPSTTGQALTFAHRIDVRRSEAQLLKDMRRTARACVQRSLRSGLIVREGTQEDVAAFYRLHVQTSQRQQFVPLPAAYFQHVWDVLHPRGALHLLLVVAPERPDEPIAARMSVLFGDTFYAIWHGWDGTYRQQHPNHLLTWRQIQWAKEHGFRSCDFEWIDPDMARAILECKPLTQEHVHSYTLFKLGFGGMVIEYPGSYDYAYNPLFGWVYRTCVEPFIRSSSIRNLLSRLAARWTRP